MSNYEVWFVVGTQHLYGKHIFEEIENNTKIIVNEIQSRISEISKIKLKAILKTSDEIKETFKQANFDDNVIGIITWMHTFSPSKMWIRGLNILKKPILQLNTQFNQNIPWDKINMDFMNLNQSAHGDREHGFIFSRMNINRKVVSGYYKDEIVLEKIEKWVRSAIGFCESQKLNIIRFGDNMRNVAVTEGDKVEAEIKLGWSINTVAVSDLENVVKKIKPEKINEKMVEYKKNYEIKTERIKSVEYQASLEIAIEEILNRNNANAFSNTFEDLAGLEQLPGLATQNLMKNGIGYAGEGDWKTAGLVYIIKKMSISKNLGTSFMEDYTYHLEKNNEHILGAHMLEVDPSIADGKGIIEVHPLSIGDRKDPARVIFNAKKGKAIQVSLIDLGNRFRLIIQDVNCVTPLKNMPNLPVARAMWIPEPNFNTGLEAWLISGGSHHTVLSYDIDAEIVINFAEMLNIEYIYISKDTTIERLKEQIRINDSYYRN